MMDATGLAPGTPVDRYVVEDVLGRGGMAVVYRVKHRQLGTLHALKVLTLHGAGVRQRLLQEGRVQALLQHPNVVAVTDIVDVDGSPGVVMEFVRGPSLDRLLADQRLTIEQCDTIAQGILQGVGAAHAHGLVHRDLKPGNIMLSITSQGLVPKICDFGLAKLMEGDGQTAIQTRSGVTMGTPAYMAPEQIRNAKAVDQRADIFALGAILYELVTSRRAFEGEDLLDIFTAVASGTFVPPRQHVPSLPDRMEAAIVGAMVVDREKRIADCTTLLAVWRGEAQRGSTSTTAVPSTASAGPFDLDGLRSPYGATSPTAVPTSEDYSTSQAKGATYSAERADETLPVNTPAPAHPRSIAASRGGSKATEATMAVKVAVSTPIAPVYGPASTIDSGESPSVASALAAMSAPPSAQALAPTVAPAADAPASAPLRRRTGLNPVWFGIVGGVGGLLFLVVLAGVASSALFGIVWFGSESSPTPPVSAEAIVVPPRAVPTDAPPSSLPPTETPTPAPPTVAPPPTASAPRAPAPAKASPADSTAAVSKPASEPPPSVAPAVAPKRASVALKGDATAWLVGSDGVEHPLPAELPPGDYTLRVQFGDLAAEGAGPVPLGAGESRTITCTRSLRRCK